MYSLPVGNRIWCLSLMCPDNHEHEALRDRLEPDRKDPTTAMTVSRSQAKRRSSRMFLNASVGLSGEDRLKCFITMPARATHLNKHEASVHLSRDLVVGSVIAVRNKRSTQVSARIVAQLSATQGVSTYGIEFIDQDERANNFWGITFPSPENRLATSQTVEQAGIVRREATDWQNVCETILLLTWRGSHGRACDRQRHANATNRCNRRADDRGYS